MEKKRIIIIDDRPLFQDALKLILQTNKNWIVSKCIPKDSETIKIIRSEKPDVALLRLSFPIEQDSHSIKQIRRYSPKTKIVVVSLSLQQSVANKIFRAGAKAYISPECKAEEFLIAMKTVLNGSTYLCNQVHGNHKAKPNSSKFERLTKREIQIIKLLRKGYSSKEIAKETSVAPRTIDNHRYKILKKLHVKNTSALIEVINEYGL
jgi:DNA-binding NarL/FixJ family response regulator